MARWHEKIIIWTACLLIAIPTCVSCSFLKKPSMRSEFTHTQLHQSVAVLMSIIPEDSDTKERSLATGFAVDNDHILTAGHFCEKVNMLILKHTAKNVIEISTVNQYGLLQKSIEGTIVRISTEHDLCLIYSADHNIKPLKLLTDISVIESEDPVTVIGAPAGYFPVRRDGRVVTNDFRNRFLLAIGVQPGCSGSPVLWKGYVIGLISEMSSTLIDGATAVRSDHIDSFLRKTLSGLKDD